MEQFLKTKIRKACNRFAACMLAALGFASCGDDNNGIMEMYGTPHADFSFKGKVVDADSRPLAGKRIILKGVEKDGYEADWWKRDTLETNREGCYEHERSDHPASYLRVVCEDPDGEYESDSTTVEVTYSGRDGWYVGKAEIEADFVMKKKPAGQTGE